MKLANALSPLTDLRIGLGVALLPTLKGIWAHPSLFIRPYALSQLYFTNLWLTFGDGTDESAKETKTELITPNAYGTVLDIGAAHGHTVPYLDRQRVTKYVALEPNVLMHQHIRAQANKAGFHEADGTLVILSCGAEDIQAILSVLNDGNTDQGPPIDTIIAILALCTVPEPQRSVSRLVRDVLKSGGQFLMYEHVLSKRSDVAWWQRVWAPLWSLGFDGCRMDRPTDDFVNDLKDVDGESAWRESKLWGKAGEDEENLFWHSVGRFTKQ